MSSLKKSVGSGKKLWLGFSVSVVLLIVIGMLRGSSAPVENGVTDLRTHTVTKGPLFVTVTETGTIKPQNPMVIRSEVAWSSGPPQILWLVSEGKEVKKGELLVRLDKSLWENQQTEREIWLQANEASLVADRENLKVTKSRAESEISTAELTVQFAKEDLDKYIHGDYPNQLKERERNVALAESSYVAAEDDLEGKKRLFEKSYVTPLELDSAQRLQQRTSLQVALAKGREDLLKQFTFKRRVDRFKADYEEAQRNLERTKLRATADLVKSETRLAKSNYWYAMGSRQQKRINQQLKNCEIYAPMDGTVLYAPRRHEPLEEGQNAHDGQELIHLLTDDLAKAIIQIRESDLGKVKVGQRVRITSDALPGEEFTGEVASISIMPDAEQSWMSSGPNTYKTEVYIDGDGSALRPGMSCDAEILVERHESAIAVPVESVTQVNGIHTVYVDNGGVIEERTVEVGISNETMIHVMANLEAGELVLLAPPLDRAAVVFDGPLYGVGGVEYAEPPGGRSGFKKRAGQS